MRFLGKYAVYKGIRGNNGALQFRLIPAVADGDFNVKEGAVMLEAAPTIGENVYDWKNNKISFAIGISDIAILFDPKRNTSKPLVHVWKETRTTKLSIAPGSESGYFFSLTQKEGDKDLSVRVPVSDGEYAIIRELLRTSVPAIIGWDLVGKGQAVEVEKVDRTVAEE